MQPGCGKAGRVMQADELTGLIELDACALSGAIARREVSAREVMAACLARIERLNPRVNALVGLLPHEALLQQADQRDAMLARGRSMGWMHGFPMAIKELSAVAGLPLSLGSPLLAGQIAAHDSLMVARMKAAGGIVIGKSNVPEFGLGSHTYNPVFGTTLNPWDTARSAGGSSGGAAVSLALRLQPVADGSDMMGSLRNPAAWNNVFTRHSFRRTRLCPRRTVSSMPSSSVATRCSPSSRCVLPMNSSATRFWTSSAIWPWQECRFWVTCERLVPVTDCTRCCSRLCYAIAKPGK